MGGRFFELPGCEAIEGRPGGPTRAYLRGGGCMCYMRRGCVCYMGTCGVCMIRYGEIYRIRCRFYQPASLPDDAFHPRQRVPYDVERGRRGRRGGWMSGRHCVQAGQTHLEEGVVERGLRGLDGAVGRRPGRPNTPGGGRGGEREVEVPGYANHGGTPRSVQAGQTHLQRGVWCAWM